VPPARAPPSAARRVARTRSGKRRAERPRALTPAETAWLLLPAAALVALGLMLVAAHPLAEALFSRTRFTFWPSVMGNVHRKPAQLARFAILAGSAVAFAVAVPIAARRPLRTTPRTARVAVGAVQVAVVVALALFWAEQWHMPWAKLLHDRTQHVYFTPATIVVAGLLAAAGALALARPRLPAALARVAADRAWRRPLAVGAVGLTALWLLPAIYTERSILQAPFPVFFHLSITFDEAMGVLDGRSPFVSLTPTYGWLVPYLIAPPLAALGASLTAFMALMGTLNAVALLAIYGVLRRLARSPLAAFALYLPFLATSLFRVQGTAVAPYDFGVYFAMFPSRYLGPFLLAWLTTRHLDGDRPRRQAALFAAAGLVVLNNADFGVPALLATVVALLCAQPSSGRAILSLCRSAVAGLAIALGLVSLLTLLRAGSLPHLGMVLRFAGLAVAGWSDIPTPTLGFHLVVLATFVAALATATARAASRHPDTMLTGMLAWTGLFGLGSGTYFAYRSHPDVLIAHFSTWALALALLVIALARAVLAREPRRVSPPELAVLVGLGLTICSIAQLPLPWQQIERIESSSSSAPFVMAAARDFVAAQTRRGERVVILTPLGHRVAYEAGVTNVLAYPGPVQMPTVQQLGEAIRGMRAEGATKLFSDEELAREWASALARAGLVRLRWDPGSRYTEWIDRSQPPAS
jgi:hypothetical protein